jgi:Uma2 family endonuclease
MGMALVRETDLSDDENLYPADDGIPMDDVQHAPIAVLLKQTLEAYLSSLHVPTFIATNNFVYYEKGDPKKNVGPDFYVILGAREDPDRDCWRVWNEGGVLPSMILELVSKKNRKKDYVTNFKIYQDTLKTPNYFIYDNRRMRFDGFKLVNGMYQQLQPDKHGRFRCDALKLLLGLQDGWLRWYRLDGTLIPTDYEIGVEQARRADAAVSEAERLRRLLLERGIDPDAP